MNEFLWVARMAFSTWLAWRIVLMLDVGNPLMGIFMAMLFMLGGPFLMEQLLEAYSESCSELGIYEALTSMQIGSPAAFAMLGVLLWAGVEALTGRAGSA